MQISKPSYTAVGSAFQGQRARLSLCCLGHAEPRLELFTSQVPWKMLQGWSISSLQERRSWPAYAWRAELSPPTRSQMEQQMHNCWKWKGRRRMDWTGSPFSCNWARDWLPSLGKHHSDVEVAFVAVMRAGCVWWWRFGVTLSWVQTIELLRK